MKLLEKYKFDKFLLIPIILFIAISLITIYSSQSLLDSSKDSLVIKQLVWYIIGIVLIFFTMFNGNKQIYKYAWILYIIGNLSLLLLLIFGTEINNAKCWFTIPGIGTIQPSEFMKIFLIIILGKLINDFNNDHLNPSLKEEFLVF